MDGDEAFLAAIAANPTDDAPRLIYADWLDEQADPRASYLRVTSEAAERIRNGRPWDDLRPVLKSACDAAPEEWRERVGPWFDVVLDGFERVHLINMIKIVREINRNALGLMETKNLVESVPAIVMTRVPLERAEADRQRLDRPWGEEDNSEWLARASLRESSPA